MFKKILFTGAAVFLGIVLWKNRRRFFDEGGDPVSDFEDNLQDFSEQPAPR